MTIQVGDKSPSATLQHMTESGPEAITTEAVFAGKKVVLFALPGAFTPTCSAKHLPGFVSQAGEILQTTNFVTRYSGTATAPSNNAALHANVTANTLMIHSIAANATGVDGNFWTVVN